MHGTIGELSVDFVHRPMNGIRELLCRKFSHGLAVSAIARSVALLS
jgi:hypothetical protein